MVVKDSVDIRAEVLLGIMIVVTIDITVFDCTTILIFLINILHPL